MKTLACSALLLAAGCAAPQQESTQPGSSASAADDPMAGMPPAPERLAQHEWLDQLVGEWDAVSEMSMGPGSEPMKMEFRESVRSLDGLWTVGEGRGTLFGQPFTSQMTLGYASGKKAFVGTWIDTMQTHMWVYVGQLDAAGTKLTLDTEGPSFDDPTKTARYRDAIEIQGKDHKVLTSSVQGEGGEWTTFLTANYRRRK